MTEFARFGDPSRFEIAMRWVADCQPRDRLPAHGGWSTGELRLTVGNLVLTRHDFTGNDHDAIRWYLLPIFEWLATNWVSLLHEERFAWRDNHAVPAATAVFMALRRLIDARSEWEQAEYAAVQGWWARHALRAADSSALFPDLVIRRLVNDVEISWTARQPSYAPDGYRFMVSPGAATLPVSEVAAPLWEALAWVVSSPPADLKADDRKSVAELERKIDRLRHLPLAALEQAYLPTELFGKVEKARDEIGMHDCSIRTVAMPAITQLDDAVLMFGGVSPSIGLQDTRTLLNLLANQAGGQDSPELAELVDTTIGAPLTAPFEEGYDLAEDLLDDLNLAQGTTVIDVRSLVSKLGIRVIERRLHTSTIRGVAIAGAEYHPAIIVNLTSAYNAEEPGRRFTLAHELFHVLYDRERARRITHSSGPWAPPGIEKRANAFAAMLLMPRHLVRHLLPHGTLDRDNLFQTAAEMEVGATALLEHLFNIGVIDEFKRDELRAALQTVV
ncbi:ImmA/IrrE family metallo-endopeptidase [Bradyrhizobium sp. SZCCHNPS1003]|uniref:ImmA/IrrE family metallo-endopeptidase n=1 Tax=Bradyrhizobium sp. SZCCHNPS1003 TaxID=3057330 RepID=UPI0028E826D5|nr:ImmA/IrrE family metallo-endopeptidase [Bradyrhizobium sp. SZCCHNPS1003]